jgi:hypothetical protein
VTERGGELGLLFLVTLETDLWLRDREQMFRFVRGMDAVTADAGYRAPAVSGALKQHMLAGVALQARIVCLLGRESSGSEDL